MKKLLAQPACVALHLLTCLFGASGLALHDRGTIVNTSDLSASLDDLKASLDSVAPSPRLPPECTKCKETGGKLSCTGMKSACNCCKTIFQERRRDLCKGFEKALGSPYTKNNGSNCMDTINAAIKQRSATCAAKFDREEPLRGITPKRFGDMCDGTKPVACGDAMCSADWGCNEKLLAAEEEYLVVAHYHKVYDGHPCRLAEKDHLRKKENAAADRAAADRAAPDREARAKAAAAALEKAAAEKAAADVEAEKKAAAEKAAAKEATVARAALKQAITVKTAADRAAQEKVVAEMAAAEKAAAAKAAHDYAVAEKVAARNVAMQRAIDAEAAAKKAAAAEGALARAVAEKAKADKAAKEKAAAHKAAAKEARHHKVDEDAAEQLKQKQADDANAKMRQREREDREMAEDAFAWSFRRRRSDLNAELKLKKLRMPKVKGNLTVEANATIDRQG